MSELDGAIPQPPAWHIATGRRKDLRHRTRGNRSAGQPLQNRLLTDTICWPVISELYLFRAA